MARGPRIAFYGHDTFGLGHLRRNLTLAHRVARDQPDAHLLALTGSNQAHAFPLPPRFDFVKIPSATKGPGGRYESRSLDLTLGELTDLRSRLIAEALLAFSPDVLLVDHAPAGMAGELVIPLERLRKANPGVRLVLGLRDVIDEPERVRAEWARDGMLDWMDRTYDRVLMYGARGLGPSPEEYGLSPRLNGRVRFTGYVLWSEPGATAEQVRRRLAIAPGERLVVATVGGGGDGEAVLAALLEGFARTPPPATRLVVVTGPLMDGGSTRALNAKAETIPSVTTQEFEPDLPSLVAAADCVVSMAGYNSMTEILAAGTPAVVVPRVAPRLEQWIRAEAMSERGLCTMLHPDEADPAALLAAIAGALARGRRTEPLPFSTDGASRVSEEMRALVAQRVPVVRRAEVA